MQKYGGNTFIIPAGPEGGEAKEIYIPTVEQQNQKTIIVE
jgi:hypothetical protein